MQKTPSIQKLIREYLEKNQDRKIFFQKRAYRTFNITGKELKINIAKTIEFLNKKGISKDDSILIMGTNSLEWITLYFSCILSGIIVVPLDTQTDSNLIKKIQKQVGAKAIFIDRFLSKKTPFLMKKYHLDELDELTEKIKETKIPNAEISQKSIQEIIYTSGSTGEPKGVVLTNENVTSALNSAAEALKLNIKLKSLNLLPLSHSFSQMHGVFLLMKLNHKIYFIDTIQPKKLINFIKLKKINVLVLVPGILTALKKELKGKSLIKELGLNLRLIGCGGAALDVEVEKWWKKKHLMVLQGYAMTEVHSVCTINEVFKSKTGSVGTVAPEVEVKIASDNEILIKGKNVMQGYYKNPEATNQAITKDGWLHTGDLGEFKDNYLYIKGRKKDMILTPSGLNVYPADIEHILDKIKDVRESCVIQKNNKIHAVIIPNKKLSESELKEAVEKANKKLLSHQKIQEYSVWHQITFPKTPLGKTRKFLVLEEINKSSDKIRTYEKEIYQIINRILKPQKEIAPTSKLSSLGMDSLKRVELVSELENEYDTEVSEEKIRQDTTVAGLEELLKESHTKRIKFKSWPLNPLTRLLRYPLQAIMFYIVVRPVTKTEVTGLENLKDLKQPVIFASNHQSVIDIGVILRAIKKSKTAVAASAEIIFGLDIEGSWIFRNFIKIRGWFTKLFYNTFPFGENIGTSTSLELTGEMLDRGYNILIFPEGTRSFTGEMLPFKHGTGFLASNMKVPIVPLRLENLNKVWKKETLKPNPGPSKLKIGKSFSVSGLSYIEATKLLEKKIKEL